MYSYVILDDNRLVLEAMIKMIEHLGLPLSLSGSAYDGVTGIQLIREVQPDIVMTDIRMPGYDGLEMLSKLRQEFNNTKFIIVSGYDDFEYARKGIQLNVSDYLLKPVSSEDLQRTLSKVLQKLDAERKADHSQKADSEFANYSNRMQEIMLWIEHHLHEPITLTDAGNDLGISSSHLSRIFKKEAKMGFSTYVTKRKMEEARRLLQNPQNKVYEVALQMGYRDYAYFFQVYKKTFGTSPTDDR